MLLFPLNLLDKNLVFFSPSSIGLQIAILKTPTSTTSYYNISLVDFWRWSIVVEHSWSLMLFWVLVDVASPLGDVVGRSKTLMLFWMLVDAVGSLEDVVGRSKTLMLFWMLVDAVGTLEDAWCIC
jgi:hypothetical protein